MAKTNFYKSLMMSEDVQSMLFTGIFVDGEGNEAECHNGAIVVKGAMADHGVYAGLKDPNVFKIAAPAADTDKLCVVDYVDVSHGEIMGVTYRDGVKTYGIPAPAGARVRVRKLADGDTGYFAAGNFVGTPAAGKFAIAEAGKTTLKVEDVKPEGKPYFEIHFGKHTTEGMVNTGMDYFVEFHA